MSSRFVISCSSRLVEARTSSRTSRTTSGSRRSRPSTSVTDAVIAATGLFSSCEAAARSERRMSSVAPIQLGLSKLRLEALARHHQRHLVGEGAHHPCLRLRQRRPVPDEDQRSDRGPAHTQREAEATAPRRRPRPGRRPSRTRAARRHGPAPATSPSARSDTSTWLRSNSRRTSASRSSAAAARSRATPTSHEITSDIARNAEERAQVLGALEVERAVRGKEPDVEQRRGDDRRRHAGPDPAEPRGDHHRHQEEERLERVREVGPERQQDRRGDAPHRPWRSHRPPARATDAPRHPSRRSVDAAARSTAATIVVSLRFPYPPLASVEGR